MVLQGENNKTLGLSKSDFIPLSGCLQHSICYKVST
jgi:hypothetical protein